ncbi:MAG TPA: hypothetical protein VMY34_10800 [Acidimicrobiales bacterium]|nr:hypothetical protein [Acidimicrobiales bacterium]
MTEADRTPLDDTTLEAEARDAQKGSDAGRGPTPEEAAAADSNDLSPGVAEHERDMLEKGANVKGEGSVDEPS